MSKLSNILFPAFLLICQLASPVLASAAEFDPNELILQRLKDGKAGNGMTRIKVLPSNAPVAVSEASAVVEVAPKEIAKPAPRAYPIVEAVRPKKIVKKKVAVKKVVKVAVVSVEDLSEIEPAAGATRAVTWFSTLSNGQRMTITFNKRPAFSYDKKTGEVVIKFKGRAGYNVPLIPEKFKGSFEVIEKLDGGNLAIRVKHKVGAERVITSNKRRVFLDIIDNTEQVADAEPVAEPKAEEKKVELPETKQVKLGDVKAEEKSVPESSDAVEVEDSEVVAQAEVSEVVEDSEVVVQAEASEVVEADELAEVASKAAPTEVAESKPAEYINYDKNIVAEKDGDIESFTFSFEDKTDAALFKRFGEYWLLFNTKDPFGLPNITKSEIISDVKRVPNAKAVVYKFTMKGRGFASAVRRENTWKVEFNSVLESPVKYPLSLKKDGAEWFVNVPGIDNSVDVKDSFTDEVLTVFPSRNSGEGFNERVVYRDFVIEKSVLGIVLRKVTEGSEVKFSRNQLRLTPSVMERKLFARDDVEDGVSEKILDFTPLRKLEEVFAGEDGRDLMRRIDEDLRGRTLFIQKFYREAAVDLGARVGFDNAFMAAASSFMSGKYAKAIADFERMEIPEFKDRNEFAMWVIAAKMEILKENPRAKVDATIPDGFALPENLNEYPVEIATALQLPIVEAALNSGKLDYAQRILYNVSKDSKQRDLDYVQYLQGKIYAAQGLNERAIEIWTELIEKTNSREVRARATYLSAVTSLGIGKIELPKTLKMLDTARILWRGGAVEFDILAKAGDLYTKNGNYPEALLAYKTAVSAIPFHPRSDEIAEQMRKVYRLAMRKDFDNLDASFDALTLYYDYLELKPTGRDGEYITIELAERLVSFDLIDSAIKVLEDFVDHVNDVEERALINTRIAILYYMARKPDEALARLEASESEDNPKYVEWQRKVLYVRMLSEQGKYDEALSKINRIPPQRARELRAEIYWFKKDWAKFIENFKGMGEKRELDVMKAAISYSMMNDDDSLVRFRGDNMASMTASKYDKAFKFITQETQMDYDNLSASLKLDFAKEVVEDYKQNLKLTDFFNKEVAQK